MAFCSTGTVGTLPYIRMWIVLFSRSESHRVNNLGGLGNALYVETTRSEMPFTTIILRLYCILLAQMCTKSARHAG